MSGQTEKTKLLQAAFAAGLSAVMPERFMADVVRQVQEAAAGRQVHLLAFGKAAGAMTTGFFANGGQATTAVVIVPEGVSFTLPATAPAKSEVIAAAHPVPNANSQRAARQALAQAHELSDNDLLVVLISGGGSSLVSLGLGKISLDDKQALNKTLLASGLSIQQINIVRKHVSAFKGGRLCAAAYPAGVMSFALSDVPKGPPGQEESAIASGPSYADYSTAEMARAIIETHQLDVPQSVKTVLADDHCESPFEDNPIFEKSRYEIVASSYLALQKAGEVLQKAGYQTVILEEEFQQDAASLAQIMAQTLAHLPEGTALISGGEASVMVTGAGVGGRNAQFALEFVLLGIEGVCGIACDTDGIDGALGPDGAVAGAVFDDQMLRRAHERGLDATKMALDNDAHRFFGALGAQIRTGPTQTNVNDLRILLKGNPARR